MIFYKSFYGKKSHKLNIYAIEFNKDNYFAYGMEMSTLEIKLHLHGCQPQMSAIKGRGRQISIFLCMSFAYGHSNVIYNKDLK